MALCRGMEGAQIGVFDNHEGVRGYLSVILEHDGHTVAVQAEVPTTAEAAAATQLPPGVNLDVALLGREYTSPERDAAEAARIAGIIHERFGETVQVIDMDTLGRRHLSVAAPNTSKVLKTRYARIKEEIERL